MADEQIIQIQNYIIDALGNPSGILTIRRIGL